MSPLAKDDKKGITLNWEAVKEIAGTKDPAVVKKYINEISGSIFFHESTSVEIMTEQINACAAIIQIIKPQDPIEAQLVIQMLSAHNIAMDCLRRANLPNQSFEGRNLNLTHANKFLRLYTDQLNTLNKHRGKGQQKVTVEYVNVEAGGQAIVGNVSAPAERHKPVEPLPTLTHQPEEGIGILTPASKEQVAVTSKRNQS